jgi:hypothetical protein
MKNGHFILSWILFRFLLLDQEVRSIEEVYYNIAEVHVIPLNVRVIFCLCCPVPLEVYRCRTNPPCPLEQPATVSSFALGNSKTS